MNRKYYIALILVLLFFWLGCSFINYPEFKRINEFPADKALIYVYRPDATWFSWTMTYDEFPVFIRRIKLFDISGEEEDLLLGKGREKRIRYYNLIEKRQRMLGEIDFYLARGTYYPILVDPGEVHIYSSWPGKFFIGYNYLEVKPGKTYYVSLLATGHGSIQNPHKINLYIMDPSKAEAEMSRCCGLIPDSFVNPPTTQQFLPKVNAGNKIAKP